MLSRRVLAARCLSVLALPAQAQRPAGKLKANIFFVAYTKDVGGSRLPYEILTGRVRPWNYGVAQNRYVNVADTRRGAISQEP